MSDTTSGIRCYQATAVQSLGPEKIVVLLYEGILRYLNQARSAIAANDMSGKARCVNRAQGIVSELRSSLDHAMGGEIAANLDAIYGYVFTENLNLLIDNDTSHVENVTRVLNPLLEVWRQIPPGTYERARQELAEAAGRLVPGPVPASPAAALRAPHGARGQQPPPGHAGDQTAAPATGSLSLAV
jgi:flagellar protein FliS